MKPVITVRRYEDHQDMIRTKEVIRDYVLSKFSTAFWFCLFREVNELCRLSQQKVSECHLRILADHSPDDCARYCGFLHLLRCAAGLLCVFRAHMCDLDSP
jgi:hypothetical protein